MKKDNQLMALLSVWGILLVVLGHSGFEEPNIQQELWWLHSWIYSFHMPLFFMISGYLFSLTNKSFVDINPGKFMWKKVLRLLVLYVTIGTVVYLIKFAFSGLSHASRDFTIGNLFYMFVAPADPNSTMGYLWYIVTLFVVFALIIFLSKLRIDLKRTLWCLAVLSLCWLAERTMPSIKLFNLNAVVHYTPYFVIGILYKKYEHSVMAFVNRGSIFLILSVLSVFLTIWTIPSWMGVGAIIRVFVGIMMSIFLCSVLLRSDKLTCWILPYSKYTYSIYILSWFGQYAAKVACINILHLHWAIAVVAMFVCGIWIPLLIDWIVDKCKLLSESKAVRLIIGY